MKLFLDDIRTPYDVFQYTVDFDYYQESEWVIVKTYEDFIHHIITEGIPELISFDHDLSAEHYLPENQENIPYDNMEVKTGYHALKWFIKYCNENDLELPKLKFHTMNLSGKINMMKLLD